MTRAENKQRMQRLRRSPEYTKKEYLQQQEYRRVHPDRIKAKTIRKTLQGCSEIEIQKAIIAWKKFDGICQACGTRCSNQFDTDHDHFRKIFRGILGTYCNRSLGLLKDNPERLRRLAVYLERFV